MTGPRVVEVGVPETDAARGYEVVVEAGSFANLGEECRRRAPAYRYAIVADSRVAELYGGRALDSLREAGCTADLYTFPAGEWNKTSEEWASLSEGLVRAGHGRDSALIALGGGVTGDLGGFVAASRGFIDDVIMPHGTRRRLCRALALLRGKELENPWKKHDNLPL